MASASTSLSEREERFGEIAFAYLRAREQGGRPDPGEWLARYPEFGTELASFFADQEDVERLGAPLREIVGAIERLSTEGPAATVVSEDAAAPARSPGGFGDYEVLGEMARGGMGVVYRARQRGLNRLVALKVVRAGEWASPEEVRRFRNEAEMVALLDHPDIVPIHEVGEQAGQLYFSMKLVEGGSLAQHLSRFRDDPRAAAALLAAVARAVHHAHQRGVLHRDLKPSNILLDADGQPHVTDFGLARRVEADSSLTQSGAIVGTPSYMAPEQATGQKGAVTTATDVYGLGAVLYGLLTGRPPFQAANVLETLVQVREREPELPRGVNRRVARDLETICLKCLVKEPQRRYGSALALADDLDRFLTGKPIVARPVGVWERGVKWARRRPLAVVAGVALLALLVLLGAGIGWVVSERTAREDRVREALAAAEPGLREGNPYDPTLIAALQRAEAQANSGMVSQDLRQQVVQLGKDVQMLSDLERIRLNQARLRDGHFDVAGLYNQHAQAFHSYGMDVETLTPEDAAALVLRSAIHEYLVVGLDDWAYALSLSQNDEQQRTAGLLLAVTRQADPDPWRGRMREMVASRRFQQLEELARTAPVAEFPPTAFGLLRNLGSDRDIPAGPVRQLLRRAHRQFPADFWVNHGLAMNLALGAPPQLEEAVGYYRAAIALRPLSPGVYLNLAQALCNKGDLDGAIAEYNEAIRLEGTYVEAHALLARALLFQGKLTEAEAAYRKAIALQSNDPEDYNNFGVVLGRLGNLAEAEAAYRKAIALRPDYALAHNNLGTNLAERGKLAEAEGAYRKAIDVKPEYAEPYDNLGRVLADQGKLAEAEAAHRKAIALQPKHADAHNNLGHVLHSLGRLADAMTAYRKAIELQPNYALAYSNLGGALIDQGKPAEAEAACRKAIELKPNLSDAHSNLGEALIQQGKPAEGEAACRKAIELQPKLAMAHSNLGQALYAQGKLTEATAALQIAIELEPGLAETHNRIGVVLRRQGKLTEAMAALRTAIGYGLQ